jgi:hypothetical protein
MRQDEIRQQQSFQMQQLKKQQDFQRKQLQQRLMSQEKEVQQRSDIAKEQALDEMAINTVQNTFFTKDPATGAQVPITGIRREDLNPLQIFSVKRFIGLMGDKLSAEQRGFFSSLVQDVGAAGVPVAGQPDARGLPIDPKDRLLGERAAIIRGTQRRIGGAPFAGGILAAQEATKNARDRLKLIDKALRQQFGVNTEKLPQLTTRGTAPIKQPTTTLGIRQVKSELAEAGAPTEEQDQFVRELLQDL